MEKDNEKNIGRTDRARVAIFGGAFDPFHRGHSAAIQHLLIHAEVDRVIVVPSGDRPDKPDVSPASDRLEIARLGIQADFKNDDRIQVSDVQARGHVGYGTIDLVRHFRESASIEPVIVVGSELVKDLPRWKNAQELKKQVAFLVLERPGVEHTQIAPGWKLTFLKPFGENGVCVSSTELRTRLGRGERCEDFVSKDVYEYCRSRGLYENPRPGSFHSRS